jgi:hypothetical protein
MSLLTEAAGLKKTGVVGGSGVWRLMAGTSSFVLPSVKIEYRKTCCVRRKTSAVKEFEERRPCCPHARRPASRK